jgi:hypothetical protein
VRLNPKADRSLLLYGYLRGSPLKPHTRIHLAGVGDFELEVSCHTRTPQKGEGGWLPVEPNLLDKSDHYNKTPALVPTALAGTRSHDLH